MSFSLVPISNFFANVTNFQLQNKFSTIIVNKQEW